MFTVHPADGAPAAPALLKAAGSRQGRDQLDRQVAVLAALHADDRLGPWARLLPRTLGTGEVDGVAFVLESRLPGTDARDAPADRVVPRALATLAELAARTAAVAPVDEAAVRRWVQEPAGHVRAVVRGRHRTALGRLETELVAALGGQEVARGWTHGDYHRANVLLGGSGGGDAGDATAVSGVVDWPEGESDGLVGADAVTLLLFEDMAAGRGELGPVLLRRLADPAPVAAAVARVRGAVYGAGGGALPARTLLLLTWLRHVGGNLAGSTRYAANPVWMHRNVRTVLAGWERAR